MHVVIDGTPPLTAGSMDDTLQPGLLYAYWAAPESAKMESAAGQMMEFDSIMCTTHMLNCNGLDGSVKLENAYKSLANKKDGAMTRHERNYNRNSEEVVSKDDLSPLPAVPKPKSSNDMELSKQKSSENMETSRKKLNNELQTANNDDEEYGKIEYEDEEYDDE
jgi:hypothetical protein